MTDWDMLYHWLLKKREVPGLLKEEIRRMTDEELFQMVVEMAERSRIRKESQEEIEEI